MAPAGPRRHAVAALAILYFLGAAYSTFPLTAYAGLLNIELDVPQAQQNLYYALTYVPWAMKPAYGLLSDELPIFGYRRRPYFLFASVGVAIAFLCTGLFVTTTEGVLLVGVARAVCSACAELMLGAALVDMTRDAGLRDAGRLQASAVGGRYAGSLLATLAGVGIYSCGGSASTAGAAGKRLSDRSVIALTAAFPASAAVLCFLLPERRIQRHARPEPHADGGDGGGEDAASVGGAGAVASVTGRVREERGQAALVLLLFPGVLLICWSAARSLFTGSARGAAQWRVGLYGVGALCFVAYILTPALLLARHRWRRSRDGAAGRHLAAGGEGGVHAWLARMGGEARRLRRVAAVSMAFLLLNGTPSASIPFTNFQYAVFEGRLCLLQVLSLFGFGSCIVACLVYGRCCNNKPVLPILLTTSAAAALLSLSRVAVVSAAEPCLQNATTPLTNFSSAGAAGGAAAGVGGGVGSGGGAGGGDDSESCSYGEVVGLASFIAALTSAISQMAFLPLLVLAAETAASTEPLSESPSPPPRPAVDTQCHTAQPLRSAMGAPDASHPPAADASASQPGGQVGGRLSFIEAAAERRSSSARLASPDLAADVAAAAMPGGYLSGEHGASEPLGRNAPGRCALWYGVMLSMLDLGDIIRSLLTAPIVAALGITFQSFGGLPDLMAIETASSLAVLACVALTWLACSRRPMHECARFAAPTTASEAAAPPSGSSTHSAHGRGASRHGLGTPLLGGGARSADEGGSASATASHK